MNKTTEKDIVTYHLRRVSFDKEELTINKTNPDGSQEEMIIELALEEKLRFAKFLL